MTASSRRRAARVVSAALLATSLLAACGDEEEPTGSGGGEPSATPVSGGSASEDPRENAGPSVEPASTKGWRTEVWHDVQVQVPGDWAVGYAPLVVEGDVLECAVGPLGSDSADGPDTTTPYVGRPGMGSDACDATGGVEVPEQDFVWFGSTLDEGEQEEGGRTVTTIEVDGEQISVGATPDVAAAILDSATEVGEDDNGCPAQPVPETRYPVEGYGAAQGVSVCYYQQEPDDARDRPSRYWSAALGAKQTAQLARAVALGDRAACDPGRGGDARLLLRASFEDDFGSKPLLRDYLVTLGECDAVLDLSEGVVGTPRPVELSPRVLDPIASDGLRAYVAGGDVPRDVASYLKPLMG